MASEHDEAPEILSQEASRESLNGALEPAADAVQLPATLEDEPGPRPAQADTEEEPAVDTVTDAGPAAAATAKPEEPEAAADQPAAGGESPVEVDSTPAADSVAGETAAAAVPAPSAPAAAEAASTPAAAAASAAADTPAEDVKGTPGSVAQLSKQLAATSTSSAAAAPALKASSGATAAGASGRVSPSLTEHDTKNTANASVLLASGAFRLQPGKDVLEYEALAGMRLEDGIDVTRKEEYLSAAAFEKVFGMSKEAFAALPAWKRLDAKKKHGLF